MLIKPMQYGRPKGVLIWQEQSVAKHGGEAKERSKVSALTHCHSKDCKRQEYLQSRGAA